MVDFKKILISTAAFILLLGLSTSFAYAADSKTGLISGSVVNLRETPDTNAKVLEKIPKGTQVSVTKVSDNWCKIKYDGSEGWISKEYITMKESSLGTATVITETLRVRSEANTASDVVTKVTENEKVTLLERSGDWYRIKTSDGKIGWVSGEYISTRKASTSRGDDVAREDQTDDSAVADAALDSDMVQKLIQYAKKFIGVRYTYGGDSPKEGFDCSGFTKYVFAHFDISLEGTAADQATQGVKVAKANLKPGDLVYFDTNGGHNHINHAGLYIGAGKFIHASSPRYDVIITELTEDYYLRSYMTARRIIK